MIRIFSLNILDDRGSAEREKHFRYTLTSTKIINILTWYKVKNCEWVLLELVLILPMTSPVRVLCHNLSWYQYIFLYIIIICTRLYTLTRVLNSTIPRCQGAPLVFYLERYTLKGNYSQIMYLEVTKMLLTIEGTKDEGATTAVTKKGTV